MCVAARNHKKFNETPYFGASGSFKVIDVDIPKKLVASAFIISNTYVPICNYFYARQANNGKIASFKGRCPSFTPLFQGNPLYPAL